MKRRTMDRHPELLCSSRGLKQCRQTVAFYLGWLPSTEISDGSWLRGMKEAVVALRSAKKIVTKLERVWYLADNSCSLYSRICGKLPTFQS
jgi:hypothetical protein